MHASLPTSAWTDRRLRPRIYVTISVTVRQRFWSGQRAELLDISTGGCRVRDVAVRPNDLVWVTMPGLSSLDGRVTWVRGWESGIEFTNPLHPAVVDHLVRDAKGPPPSV